MQNFELIGKNATINLQGVEFDFNKATLRAESYTILNEAAQILKNNPTIQVEIHGHTDNVGARSYNMELSRDRAESVMNYLIESKGINPTRLQARGFGPDKPIASNATESGRQENRRVEFVVVGVK